jgi:hypothetical protein
MKDTWLGVGLRAVAVAIAVAALIDPVLSLAGDERPIVVVNLTSGRIDHVVRGLEDAGVRATMEVRVADAARVPCSPAERCLVVADGSTAPTWPADLLAPIGLVTTRQPAAPNITVRAVSMAGRPHVGAAGAAQVVLDGQGVAGSQSEVRLLAGELPVGSATHVWKTDGTATVTVPWWPPAVGPLALRAIATPIDDEPAFDNGIDIGVDVTATPWAVLMYEPRPTWAGTAVRRALEGDPRFRVERRATVAPNIRVTTPGGRLDVPTLDAADAVVIGVPEAMSAGDVALIERYVRVRGGTAILLPQRAPTGPLTRLTGTAWRERLVGTAESVGDLRATEILTLTDVPLTSRVLARAGDSAAIVLTPSGAGRVIVSGAMDAWRYREPAGAFDRAWQSLVADGAAAGTAVRVEFDRRVAAPHTRLHFRVRHLSMSSSPAVAASAVARCDGGAAMPVRVWPTAESGVFTGELPIGRASACVVDATVGERTATAGIAVRADIRTPVSASLAELARIVRERGGVVTGEDDLSSIATAGTDEAPLQEPAHPLRSPWWLLPLAGSLSLEWWWRRRNGLR